MSVRRRKLAARAGAALAATTVLALGGAAIQAAPALATAAPLSPCASVDLIVARASTEAPGTGAIGALAEEIQAGVKASVSKQAVNYPAQLFPYEPSVQAGDKAIRTELEEEVSKCPSTKVVLLGYSQGAQIVGDVLGGGGGNAGDGPENAPASKTATAKVIGVIQYGDPRHLPNKSYDVGTDPGATGLFPRKSNQSIDGFASDIQSYCDTGDPFCAKGNNLSAHLDYVEKYDKTADKFIIGRLSANGIS
jgi:acetylxylan esterase